MLHFFSVAFTEIAHFLHSAAEPMPADLMLHLSEKGRAFLEREEGCRLNAYHDSKGVLTIGYGHTSNAPSRIAVKLGMTITPAQADAMFRQDIASFEIALNNDLARHPTQEQFDAMLSLEYNIGMGGMKRSSVVRDFNRGKPVEDIARDFLLWSKPTVLLARRKREAALFETGVYA